MSEPSPAPDSLPPSPTPGMQHTHLGGKWLGKTLIFLIVLIGFGVWGLYDAMVVYPNRGIEYAENAKLQYLKAAKASASLYNTNVADPVAAYARVGNAQTLKTNAAAAGDPANRDHARAAMDVALFNWLDGLDTIGRLKPEFTKIEKPEEELAALDKTWATRNQPKPLAKWDLPVQWLFVAVGLGGGAALLLLVVKVKSRSYGWDPAEQRLTLADGSTLVPADIAEFDKRKWDKFLVFLKIKPGHSQHGGKELKLDLYRYVPLEEWVLTMERTAYPEHAAPPSGSGSGSGEPPPPTEEPPAAAA